MDSSDHISGEESEPGSDLELDEDGGSEGMNLSARNGPLWYSAIQKDIGATVKEWTQSLDSFFGEPCEVSHNSWVVGYG